MITELHPLLVQPLIEYLGEGRPALLRAAQHSTPIAAATSLTAHRYVFVNRSGRPFSAPSWTQLVQGVFERETGRRIGNNLLRDSFVTHVYAGDVSDRLKHALAEHMGHRPQTAERVYNRMPGVERRRPALELASQLALGLGTP
jgi:site-specific recombinase XerD